MVVVVDIPLLLLLIIIKEDIRVDNNIIKEDIRVIRVMRAPIIRVDIIIRVKIKEGIKVISMPPEVRGMAVINKDPKDTISLVDIKTSSLNTSNMIRVDMLLLRHMDIKVVGMMDGDLLVGIGLNSGPNLGGKGIGRR